MAKKDAAKEEKMIPPGAARFDSVSAALQLMHDAVAAEVVPDEFLRILDEIDAKIASSKRIQ
ncbi:MAG: hypothetical protein ABI673_04400 [Novosphingobium sp.]